MMKAIWREERDTQEKMRSDTIHLRLTESMQSLELSMWKEKAIKIQEAFDVRIKMHEVERDQWAIQTTQLEAKVMDKNSTVRRTRPSSPTNL